MGKQMTVFEYMQQLPQPLFEATLMGLMGIPFDFEKEVVFHDWMNSPYEVAFESLPIACEVNMPPTNKMLALLGQEIQKLPSDQQEKLKNAMKDYCEVCDVINQSLSEQKH